jgi:FkbM family methyltransferase
MVKLNRRSGFTSSDLLGAVAGVGMLGSSCLGVPRVAARFRRTWIDPGAAALAREAGRVRPITRRERLGYAAALLFHRPSLLARKLGWRLRSAVLPRTGVRTWTINGRVRFTADLGRDPSIRLMRCGAYDLELMQLLRDELRPGDTMIDIGASIGYVSAFAASLVGPEGALHSFEPDPGAVADLQAMARANPAYRIHVNQVGLADAPGSAELSIAAGNIGWKTMVPGLMHDAVSRVSVPITTFDDHAERIGLTRAKLIKIDTEGFEYRVLGGMRRFLAACRPLPLIACEVAPSAFPRLGITADDLARRIDELGYRVVDPTDLRRAVALDSLERTSDVVLIPRER